MLDPNIQLTRKGYFKTFYYIGDNKLKMSIRIDTCAQSENYVNCQIA